MKIVNAKNNVQNKISSILMDDRLFPFKFKKKSKSSMWSYFDSRNNKGITLIALTITIILMLILAGVVINLTLR